MLVLLKKDGLYYGKDKIEDISLHLNCSLEIEGDVTLENLFDVLMTFGIEEINFLFNSWTLGYDIGKYYEYMQVESERDPELIYLDVRWATDYFTYEDDDCVKQSEFSSYIDVSGVGENEIFGISLTPIYELKDLILRIDNKFEIEDFSSRTKPKIIFTSIKEISLNEFIGGILHEISFHGYPEDKEMFCESLEETSALLDSGEMETISHDVFMLDILEKDLERLVSEEKFEKAAKVKKEIEEYKLKKNKK